MSLDSRSVQSSSSADNPGRRRLLALLGVGGAAVLANQLTPQKAQAGHAPGAGNFSSATAAPAIHAENTSAGDGTGMVVERSGAGTGTAIEAITTCSGDGNGLVAERHNGDGEAIIAFKLGTGDGHTIEALRDGPGDGVAINATRSGSGGGYALFASREPGGDGEAIVAQHHSENGAALSAHSDKAFAGMFSTGEGDFAVHIGGSATEFALGVDNGLAGEAAGGLLAVARGGKPAIEGDAIPSDFSPGIGVQGVSGYAETFGQGPGVGVQGISGSGVGVHAVCSEGTALFVEGKSAFSTAGIAFVPARQTSVFVANEAVTEGSHISVTLTSDPGPRALQWVRRHPGAGFTVHLTLAPTKARPQTSLSYLIVEPAGL